MEKIVQQKKKQEHSMALPRFCNPRLCIPGFCCSICCTIFSIWGFVVLIVVGVLLDEGYRKIDNNQVSDDKLNSTAVNTYVAAAIFMVCVIGCGARWLWLLWHSKPVTYIQTMDGV